MLALKEIRDGLEAKRSAYARAVKITALACVPLWVGIAFVVIVLTRHTPNALSIIFPLMLFSFALCCAVPVAIVWSATSVKLTHYVNAVFLPELFGKMFDNVEFRNGGVSTEEYYRGLGLYEEFNRFYCDDALLCDMGGVHVNAEGIKIGYMRSSGGKSSTYNEYFSGRTYWMPVRAALPAAMYTNYLERYAAHPRRELSHSFLVYSETDNDAVDSCASALMESVINEFPALKRRRLQILTSSERISFGINSTFVSFSPSLMHNNIEEILTDIVDEISLVEALVTHIPVAFKQFLPTISDN